MYLGLAADINRLSARFGESSNLILDPDLDTYYLIDATLIKMPEIQKILSEIRLISQKISLRSEALPEESAQLITLSGRLREINNDLAINREVAFENNPQGNLRGKLSEDLKSFNSVTDLLTKQLDKLIPPTALVDYSTYVNQSDLVLNLSFKLWDKTVNQLDFLLQIRIDGFLCRWQLISVFMLIILALVIYLFVSFYRYVMQKIFVFHETLNKIIINGYFNDKNIWENHDKK